MKQPAYHLRQNKAVDRLTLIEAIKHVGKLNDLSEYTYYGFGGWTLEDFRLIYEFYPEISMISIENDRDNYNRQRFHTPCRSARLKLEYVEFKSFLARYEAKNSKSIFWLDYIDLKYARFEEFMVLLGKVFPGSVVKITLRCEPSDYFAKEETQGAQKTDEFQREFQELLPHSSDQPPVAFTDLAKLVQDMAQIATERALSSATPLKFIPISSFCYADGAGMFTLTGVVCFRTQETLIKNTFQKWRLANLEWNNPRVIDVPTLSTKERLHLQRCLPAGSNAGRVLRKSLGYLIDSDERSSEAKLQQYADFHRYFPYFVKATP